MTNLDVTMVLLILLVPWVAVGLWLGRWFRPAVRGAFNAQVPPIDRLKLRALPLRDRFSAWLRMPRSTIRTAIVGSVVFLLLSIVVTTPDIPRLVRACAAQTLNQPPPPLRTADVIAFTRPILEKIEAGEPDAGDLPAMPWSEPAAPPPDRETKRSSTERMGLSLWLDGCQMPINVCRLPREPDLLLALESLSEHSELVKPELLEYLAGVLAQRGDRLLSRGEWREAAEWWQLVEDYLEQTEVYSQLRAPVQPWRVASAQVSAREKRILVKEFLAYGRGDLTTREAWSDAEDGQVFAVLQVTLLRLGRAQTEAFSSSFALQTSEGVRTPLGFKQESGCVATFDAPAPASLGPESVDCKLVFSVPESFTTGELLMFGVPVATVQDVEDADGDEPQAS